MKKCFVCGSKSHLIKDCTYHEQRMGACARKPRQEWKHVQNIPPYASQATKSTSRYNTADNSVSAEALDSADRPSPSHKKRKAARPFHRPTISNYQNAYWPGFYHPMYMGWGHHGKLLLSPQQVVLGIIWDLIYKLDPRTIVDLIHLHGLFIMIYRAGSSQ